MDNGSIPFPWHRCWNKSSHGEAGLWSCSCFQALFLCLSISKRQHGVCWPDPPSTPSQVSIQTKVHQGRGWWTCSHSCSYYFRTIPQMNQSQPCLRWSNNYLLWNFSHVKHRYPNTFWEEKEMRTQSSLRTFLNFQEFNTISCASLKCKIRVLHSPALQDCKWTFSMDWNSDWYFIFKKKTQY